MVNPYTALRAKLASGIYLAHSSSYNPQLYTLSAISAVLLFLVIVSIAVRIHKRTFWLIKMTPAVNGKGTFITPHSVVWWSLFSVVYLGKSFAFFWRLIWVFNRFHLYSALAGIHLLVLGIREPWSQPHCTLSDPDSNLAPLLTCKHLSTRMQVSLRPIRSAYPVI